MPQTIPRMNKFSVFLKTPMSVLDSCILLSLNRMSWISSSRLKSFVLLSGALPLLAGVVGCKSLGGPKNASDAKTTSSAKNAKAQAVEQAVDSWRPRLGTISLVDEKAGFVLLDIGTAPAPSAGTELRSYSQSASSAELVVSAFQRRPFLIANIRHGHPTAGESVALISSAKASEKSVSGTPLTPDAPVVTEVSGGVVAPGKPAPASRVPRLVVPSKSDDTQYALPMDVEPASEGVIPGLPTKQKK